MEPQAAMYFRDELRKGRAAVLRDAENFLGIATTLENLGSYVLRESTDLVTGRPRALELRKALARVAKSSVMGRELPPELRPYHVSFERALQVFFRARNAAVHEGALARHLTVMAQDIALVLEEALMATATIASELMVRDPVIASSWQPISYVRRTMLLNSFSYLPIWWPKGDEGKWRVLADADLVKYMRRAPSENEERKKLTATVGEAIESGQLEFHNVALIRPDTEVREFSDRIGPLPALIVNTGNGELLGIVTAFDLL